MCRNSQRILVEAAYIGVFRREESSLRRIPQSSLPVPKFAAKVVPCSYPLKDRSVPFATNNRFAQMFDGVVRRSIGGMEELPRQISVPFSL